MKKVGLLSLLFLMSAALGGDDFVQALRLEKKGDRLRAAYHYRLATADAAASAPQSAGWSA